MLEYNVAPAHQSALMLGNGDNMSDVASEREDDSGIESSAPDPAESAVFIRIGVPELKVQVGFS